MKGKIRGPREIPCSSRGPRLFPASIAGSSQAPVSLGPRGSDHLASADTCMHMYLSHVNTHACIHTIANNFLKCKK